MPTTNRSMAQIITIAKAAGDAERARGSTRVTAIAAALTAVVSYLPTWLTRGTRS